MKKKKLLIILFLLILTTGCGNVSYNIDIRRDKIYENLKIEIKKIEQTNSLSTIVEENLNSYPENKLKNLSYEILNDTVNINNWYNNIYNLANDELVNRMYENVDVSIDNGITDVIFSNYNNSSFECGEFDEGCLLVLDKVEVNLISEYEIIDSNADIVDTKNNKYTWMLDINSSDIYFSYSNKVLWNIVIKNYVNEHYEMLIIIGICLAIFISGIIFITKFIKRFKENNS